MLKSYVSTVVTAVTTEIRRHIIVLQVFAISLTAYGIEPKDFVVQLSAQAQVSPPRIILRWPHDPVSLGYKVYRKSSESNSWGTPIATLAATATSFSDSSVTMGIAYEYQLVESTAHPPWPNGDPSGWITAYGYISAGIAVPAVENRGKLLLIVDDTHSSALSSELNQFHEDLIGDGWTVIRRDVPRTASPGSVRSIIRSEYEKDPQNVRSVILFGHVPVPYSGNFNPDMHANHKGAWPADLYYGDMNGNWTDHVVHYTQAEDPRNHNRPGDGKFDQSDLPSDVELQVGRIDFANMPAFLPKTETDLLRQYLFKNHNHRHALTQVERRGLIRDQFGEINGDAPAATAWRAFGPLVGWENISTVPQGSYFSTLTQRGFLWSYGGGGGGHTKADGVGTTTDFARNDTRTVFTILHGSYFGDWDAENSLLRAPLATQTYGLTCVWAGLPHWFLHHMGLGETIGYSTLLTQNNAASGLYSSFVNLATRQVHIALMGDPTLRLFAVSPASQLKASTKGTVSLTWNGSPDPDVRGYYLYRANSPEGPFVRLTRAMITGTSYIDTTPLVEARTYMLRAVKLETTASGSFYNLSQGVFTTVEPPPDANFTSKILSISRVGDQVALTFTGKTNSEYRVEYSDDLLHWEPLGTGLSKSSAETEFIGNETSSGTRKFYRIVWPLPSGSAE